MSVCVHARARVRAFVRVVCVRVCPCLSVCVWGGGGGGQRDVTIVPNGITLSSKEHVSTTALNPDAIKRKRRRKNIIDVGNQRP